MLKLYLRRENSFSNFCRLDYGTSRGVAHSARAQGPRVERGVAPRGPPACLVRRRQDGACLGPRGPQQVDLQDQPDRGTLAHRSIRHVVAVRQVLGQRQLWRHHQYLEVHQGWLRVHHVTRGPRERGQKCGLVAVGTVHGHLWQGQNRLGVGDGRRQRVRVRCCPICTLARC